MEDRADPLPDAGDGAAPPRKRRGIQSILTGFRIIDCLVQAGEPLPLKELAARAGLTPSNLQFYLISLSEVGIVTQEPRTGRYGLGPYSLQLGIFGLQQFDVYKSAFHRIEALARDTGHAVFLGVWGNAGPTIIHRAEGSYNRSVFELRLGSVLPLLRSALGRLFLAHLPEDLTRAMLERELQDLATANTVPEGSDIPRSRVEAREMAEAVRAGGLSRCRGGLLSDHTAISAPVFDHTGRILAGMTIMGHVNVLSDDPEGPVARVLRETARTVSDEAGATARHGFGF